MGPIPTGAKLGYDLEALDRVKRRAVEMLVGLRQELETTTGAPWVPRIRGLRANASR